MSMDIFFKALLALTFGCLCACIAHKQGRKKPVIWFLVGFFLGIFGLLLVFILPRVTIVKSNTVNKAKPEASSKTHSNTIVVEPIVIEETKWYYLNSQHEQQGPIFLSELKNLYIDNAISKATYVWQNGMMEWKRIQELPDLIRKLEEKE